MAAGAAIDKKPMKPEDVLRAIQAARGSAICVPTMTTAPAGAPSRPTISRWDASASWAARPPWGSGWPSPVPTAA
jgi:hypothetical protein